MAKQKRTTDEAHSEPEKKKETMLEGTVKLPEMTRAERDKTVKLSRSLAGIEYGRFEGHLLESVCLNAEARFTSELLLYRAGETLCEGVVEVLSSGGGNLKDFFPGLEREKDALGAINVYCKLTGEYCCVSTPGIMPKEDPKTWDIRMMDTLNESFAGACPSSQLTPKAYQEAVRKSKAERKGK
ncbi:hypothetical protein HN832_01620 [archaeon]|jgi:hypothetical protein|nr:hypothetical protein [archaeon]MBT4373054.1 hypothetical protein [archaeon]MBT4531399.1 hypothetical protein [archaeon]MBT7001423.1 hypothetical protein [archaeon]MBT7282091.1 hypothetical protein [archaeon]